MKNTESCLFIYFWFIYSCECVCAPESASPVSLLSSLLLFEAAAKTSFSSQQVLQVYLTFFLFIHAYFTNHSPLKWKYGFT